MPVHNDHRLNFKSSEHFIEAHLQYLDSIKNPSHPEIGKQHPFVINLRDNCGADCHGLVINAISATQDGSKSVEYDKVTGEIIENHRYRYLSGDKAVATVSSDLLDSLIYQYPLDILGYAPVLPEVKVQRQILVDNSITSLSLSVAPLSEEELNTFVSDLEKLGSSTVDNSTLFTINTGTLRPNKSIYFTINLLKPGIVANVAKMLSLRREILWLEWLPPVYPLVRWAKGVVQSNSYSNTPLFDLGLTGKDEIVGVADTGIDMKSCYFYDTEHKTPVNTINLNHRKVVQYITQPSTDQFDGGEAHGTHVSSTIAGFSLKSYGDFTAYNGMIYDAKISFFDMGSPSQDSLVVPNDIDTDMFSLMYASGARTFCNSWGTPDNSYSKLSKQTDRFMKKYPDALVLFANGNNGSSNYNTVGSPATCKNCVGVGASLNDYQSWLANNGGSTPNTWNSQTVAAFSSRGPTHDGRMKPDILSVGWWVNAAAGNPQNSSEYHCSIKALRGTSMATPLATAAAAMVRSYFRNGFYPSGKANASDAFIPSGALLKAILVHSGQKMSTLLCNDPTQPNCLKTLPDGYPSYYQGYGRIELQTVLHFATATSNPITFFVVGASTSATAPKSRPYLYKALKQGNVTTYNFTTNPDKTQSPIRVTLCYVDEVPADGASGIVFINLLRLQVTEISINDRKDMPSYQSFTKSRTTQVVDIASPQPSATYTVSVIAEAVSSGTAQPYALVVTGKISVAPPSPPPPTIAIPSIQVASKELSTFAVQGITILSCISFAILALVCTICVMNRGRGKKADGVGASNGGSGGAGGSNSHIPVRRDDVDGVTGDDGDIGFDYDHVSP